MRISLSPIHVPNRLKLPELSFAEGQCIHIVGQNGAGKSTLLDVLAGLDNTVRHCVSYNDKLLSTWLPATLATARCYLVQSVRSEFDIKVYQLLSFFSAADIVPEPVENALNLKPLIGKPINQLSGGEQQRVQIARNLLQIWPALERGEGAVLLDEPTQHLDVHYQLALMHLLSDLASTGNLVLQTCHDINLTARFSNQCLLLNTGSIVAFGETRTVLTPENLRQSLGCDFHLTYAENAYEFFYPVLNSDTSV